MYRYLFVQTKIKSAINKETVLLNWQNINFSKLLSRSCACNRREGVNSRLRTSRITSVGRRCANFDVIHRHETNLPSIKRHSFAWHATQYWRNRFFPVFPSATNNEASFPHSIYYLRLLLPVEASHK